MQDSPQNAAWARLYELLDEIEGDRHDLSPANRAKITRAVCELLTRKRPSSTDANGYGLGRASASTSR